MSRQTLLRLLAAASLTLGACQEAAEESAAPASAPAEAVEAEAEAAPAPPAPAPEADMAEEPSEPNTRAGIASGAEEEEAQADPGTLGTDEEDEAMQAEGSAAGGGARHRRGAQTGGVAVDNPPGSELDGPLGEGAGRGVRRPTGRVAPSSPTRSGGTVGAFDIEE